MSSIAFRKNTASEDDILSHLSKCDGSFVPPLSNRVDLISYSKKIVEKAITFEAWHEEKLVGLVAAYFNDTDKRTGFITNMSVVPEYTGRRIASELLLDCINYGVKGNFCDIRLKVNRLSLDAISFYKKHNFVEIDERDDTIIMELAKESR